MGDVVDLRPEESLGYWRCECGCSTFYVRDDEELECANEVCAGLVRGNGFWAKPASNEPPRDPNDDDPSNKSRIDLGDPRAAFDNVLRWIKPETTSAIIIMDRGGGLHVWGHEFHTRASRGWLRYGLDQARKMLTEVQ